MQTAWEHQRQLGSFFCEARNEEKRRRVGGSRGRGEPGVGVVLEDGHVTRQQPSREAESRSSVKFSGSERLADYWWKKIVCASPRQAELDGGREGGRDKQKREGSDEK